VRLEFFPKARSELRAAALFYESRQMGLGKRFKEEVAHVCAAIRRDPLLWRERAAGYRRVNCPVFPCYIAYIVERDIVLIAAVAHAHRDPDYWKDRLPET